MRKKHLKSKKVRHGDEPTIIHPHAASLDIGAREIWACVPSRRTVENVRVFSIFTADLHALAGAVVVCGVATVAMESTGVY